MSLCGNPIIVSMAPMSNGVLMAVAPSGSTRGRIEIGFYTRRSDREPQSDHYTIISADCHAGGSHEMYREFLDPAYRDDFDAWRERYKNPFRDLQDGGRIRNWDDDQRNGDLEADGIVGEVVFPNTVPAVLPQLRAVRPAAPRRRVRAPPGRHPRPQPLDGRLVRAVPRSPRRHRADLPQRRRRGASRRPVDPRQRAARRRADLGHPARRRLREAAVRPDLRPDLGAVRRARPPGQQPRRHRASPTTAGTRRPRCCSSPR